MLKNPLKNKKNITFFIFIVLVIVSDIVFYSKFIYNDTSYYIDNYESSSESYITEEKTIFEQEFIATKNDMESISIGFDKNFRTYNDEKVKIKIIDVANNNVIGEYDNIYQEIVKDYKEYKFDFDKQNDSIGKKYKIIVEYENGTAKNPILYNAEKNISNGILKINGEEVPFNINFKVFYHSKYANKVFWISMIGISILAIVGIGIFTYKTFNIEKAFLILVTCIGVIYVFIVPIYRGHDEHAHFFRAYEISKGVFNTKIVNNASVTEIPNAFEATTLDTGKYCNETSYKQNFNFLKVQKVEGENFYEGGSYMAVYSPIPYIPQAVAIFFLDLITNNVAVMFYGARIANLLIAILMLYLAMKIIPYGKKAILYIVIIPTTMAQIASMSPDAMTITSCILLIAYILKVLNKKEMVNKKDIFILTGLGSLVALCKIVYIPFVLLTLLIPSKKYTSKKSRIISSVLMIMIPIFINLVWLKIAGTHLQLIDNNKSSVQTNFIFANIFEYARIALFTVENCFTYLVSELFGGTLLHNDLVNNGMIVSLPMIIILIFEVLFDKDIKDRLNCKHMICFCISIFIILGAIATSLYLQWSPYKWYFINGIQGRYFIAILLPFILLLGQNKLINQEKEINMQLIIEYSAIMVNFISLIQIVLRFI